MPTPGPVAYQRQSLCFVLSVMVFGGVQVTPSSMDELTQHSREPLLVPFLIASSRSAPRFRVISSQIVPVERSTTGQGLPQVLSASFQTTSSLPHVFPP